MIGSGKSRVSVCDSVEVESPSCSLCNSLSSIILTKMVLRTFIYFFKYFKNERRPTYICSRAFFMMNMCIVHINTGKCSSRIRARGVTTLLFSSLFGCAVFGKISKNSKQKTHVTPGYPSETKSTTNRELSVIVIITLSLCFMHTGVKTQVALL